VKKARSIKVLLPIVLAVLSSSVLLSDALQHVRKAPELSFEIPGKGQQLLSQYKGKVVALEFIFTTCPHCQAASRVMTKLQTEYGPKGLQVIDVAVNPNADLLVENFAKDYQVNFPVGWTTQAAMQSFMGFDQRFVVPQLALIDRKGFIHYQTPALSNNDDWGKVMNEQSIRQHIEELLSL
jgi:thiol-disulfide isomerase/thioredoxin